MCGIVGYVGGDEALPVLLDGMAKLEYRGYDSAGVAVISDGHIEVARKAGELSKLQAVVEQHHLDGSTGIGHTRWATHGAPNDTNAHPHRDCTGDIALVHNGIIENHDVLRSELETAGHEFRSETDTEVVAHLLESLLAKNGGTLREAMLAAVARLEGAFALVCVRVDEPDVIVVARQEPPIIVGAADGIGLVGSDIPALLAYTRDVIPLDNYQV
ncbi:MAG: class II glutamine amidotransferase, partial [Actinomycetota bacterium]|nr:class II glutamine amidotransferase [Actinomycetota bacterium]